ncbi:MAG TPA: GGDEF domain-containing protein [Vicinamibacterales bacterium]
MQRSTRYSWAGGLLSAGAPLGLLLLRLARRRPRPAIHAIRDVVGELKRDRLGYLYVGASTAVVFSLFGFILGRQADQLLRLSRTDPLTGLSNARELFERLDVELIRCRRRAEPLTMLVIDLDGLKRINDEHGHRAGDQALRRVADAIRSVLRRTDCGARWGGDEFAVLAPGISGAAGVALAERIRASIQQGTGLPLSASIGVASFDPGGDPRPIDADALMHAADAAMYEAKRRGRNTVVVAARVHEAAGHT